MKKVIFLVFLGFILFTNSAEACSLENTSRLSLGLKNKNIVELQNCLIKEGFEIKGGATGYYGNATREIIKQFYSQKLGISWHGKSFGPKALSTLKNKNTQTNQNNLSYKYVKNNTEFQKYLSSPNYLRNTLALESTTAPTSNAIKTSSLDRVSNTNVQVVGIDEPDIVKTDGVNLFMAKPNTWYHIMPLVREVSESVSRIAIWPPFQEERKTQIIKVNPVSDISLLSEKIPESGEMLLDKNNKILTIFSNQKVTGFNVANTINPTQKWQIELDNNTSILTSRMKGSNIYLVLNTYVYSGVTCPVSPFLKTSTLDKLAIPCNQILVPEIISPISQIYTVLKVDTKTGKVLDKVSIAENGYGGIVSMFENNLYLANEIYQANIFPLEAQNSSDTVRTKISRISLNNLDSITTGVVKGRLLNQFALDEYNGYLRAATTVGETWQGKSSNEISILDMSLKEKANIKDLGLTERIYSVRFVGDVGYLVTFRQIDPFYVLDLKDPLNPKITGELKIPGYSSYLEDLGNGFVLGVGREEGDLKLSLFNVKDPKNPTEVSKYLLKNMWSEVENNHRAFLHDKDNKVFFIPTGSSGYIFSYENNTLSVKKVVTGNNIKRAIYIGDYMYIVSDEKIYVLDEKNWDIKKEWEIK